MCGITGYYSRTNFFQETDLNRMTSSLAHRGPDAEGLFRNATCGLGHRRLSILDLSAAANQPFYSKDRKHVLVYNGEIYNFKQLKADLIKNENRQFSTTSDTEVVLEGLISHGIDFLKELNGMFALAWYDIEKDQLLLARDRVGIKPLYYYFHNNQFAFASELKALTRLKQLTLDIDPVSVRLFLQLGYIPAPQSIYSHIQKLRPAHYLLINSTGITTNCYHDIYSSIQQSHRLSDETEAKRELSSLLDEAVALQLQSDVPLGVFLSGGIDSGIVAAKAAKLSNSRIKTFTIGLENKSKSEAADAEKIANYLGTEHHTEMIGSQKAASMIEEMLHTFDEPFADSSAIPTMLVSQLAKKQVSVSLSGDGGDELFHGYGSYQWAGRLHQPFIQLLRKPIAAGLKQSINYRQHANYFLYPSRDKIAMHLFSVEQRFFTETELHSLLHPSKNTTTDTAPIELFSKQLTERFPELNPSEVQALFDLNYYLPDDLLTKVDRSSMHFSLETRVPLLDNKLIDFSNRLAPELKFKQGIRKYLLKQVLFESIPASFYDRPKSGFSIPLQEWLKTDLTYLIDTYLAKSVVEKFQFVNYKVVEKLVADFTKNNRNHLYNRIWNLIVLHHWLLNASERNN